MKKSIYLLLLFLGGCQGNVARPPAGHVARLAVAEWFCFNVQQKKKQTRRALPPRAVEPAAGGAVFPASCPLPAGRQLNKRKGLFHAKRRRSCE